MNSCAIVTGASSGIGRSLALELARRGAALGLVARNPARLEAVRSDCLAAGARRVETWHFDLSDVAGIDGLVTEVQARLSEPVQLAIHGAGLVLVARVEDHPLAQTSRLINVNLLAGFGLARALIPAMRLTGGTIGFISSGSAYRALPYQWAYAASKAGIERLAEALRVELADTEIRVRVVSPGPVDTDMTTNPPTIAPAMMVSGTERARSPQAVAPALPEAFGGRAPRREFAGRVRMARWLSAFGAEPFDTLLRRRR
jgi:3-oxoacyl-[acyl-carrier protein] reductase